jgi:hypothetical protein
MKNFSQMLQPDVKNEIFVSYLRKLKDKQNLDCKIKEKFLQKRKKNF